MPYKHARIHSMELKVRASTPGGLTSCSEPNPFNGIESISLVYPMPYQPSQPWIHSMELKVVETGYGRRTATKNPFNGIERGRLEVYLVLSTSLPESIQWNWKRAMRSYYGFTMKVTESIQWNWKTQLPGCLGGRMWVRIHSMELKS